MKRILLIAALLMPLPALAADLGISISVGEPGFYGQINIGDYPKPDLIYAQPVIVEHDSEYERAEPIYLHVPPGYEKHWSRHCREYRACGRRVYFVRDRWYNKVYVPHYREHERMRHEEGRDAHHGERHDEGHDGRRHGEGRGYDD